MGGETIPAGTYSIFTVPEENGGKLIINKQTGQSGTKYDEKQDLVRVDLKKEPLNPAVHQFAMAIEKSDGGGVLKLMWEDSQVLGAFHDQEIAKNSVRRHPSLVRHGQF